MRKLVDSGTTYKTCQMNFLAAFIETGKIIRKEYGGNFPEVERKMRDVAERFAEFAPEARQFMLCGYLHPEYALPEARDFYRIGEPVRDGLAYRRSRAGDRIEDGVAVVTPEWLKSRDARIYGMSDEIIEEYGVYLIHGILLPGEIGDEPMIYPTDWARKTDIRTQSGLEAAVKKLEREYAASQQITVNSEKKPRAKRHR